MLIRVVRFFGNRCRTLSRVCVFAGSGVDGELPVLECAAVEPSFRDYRVVFSGVRGFCLPVGSFVMKTGVTEFGLWGLRILGAPGHLGAMVGFAGAGGGARWNMILLGRVEDEGVEDEVKRVVDGEGVFRRLEGLVRCAFVRGEEMRIEICNSFV